MIYTNNAWEFVVNGWLIEDSIVDCQYLRIQRGHSMQGFQEYKDVEKQNIKVYSIINL